MAREKGKKVVSLAAREEAKQLQEATLYAEAMCRDNPSKDAQAYYDQMLDRGPDEWRRHGELSRVALEEGLKGLWLGYATKASVMRGAELLKQELGYEEASPAERVLIEHAAVCHVRLGMVELKFSNYKEGRLDIIEFYERRLTLTQKRFTRAMTALARVRGLLARADAAREAVRKASVGRSLAVLKQMTG